MRFLADFDSGTLMNIRFGAAGVVDDRAERVDDVGFVGAEDRGPEARQLDGLVGIEGHRVHVQHHGPAPYRRYRAAMSVLRTIALFAVAAVAEIGGAWLVWQGVREDRGVAWIGAGIVALAGYGFVATLQEDAHFGRILAAYGGIFVAGSLAWGVVADGFRPDRYDLLGAAICLAGVGVIMFAPGRRSRRRPSGAAPRRRPVSPRRRCRCGSADPATTADRRRRRRGRGPWGRRGPDRSRSAPGRRR